MIEAFSRLAVKPQKMCILSGSAFVMYDGTYKLYEAEIGGEKLSQISFNKQSDLAYPPDGNYVFKLKNFFQGSIISLRFSLNSRHLDEVEEE